MIRYKRAIWGHYTKRQKSYGKPSCANFHGPRHAPGTKGPDKGHDEGISGGPVSATPIGFQEWKENRSKRTSSSIF
jgi:hypothetical protein